MVVYGTDSISSYLMIQNEKTPKKITLFEKVKEYVFDVRYTFNVNFVIRNNFCVMGFTPV